MFKKIKKRDGSIVGFDSVKITSEIERQERQPVSLGRMKLKNSHLFSS